MTSEVSVQIADAITEFVIRTKAPLGYDQNSLPRDQSLVELGILDSFGVIELIEFLEEHWQISIKDEEVTRERMGSINKMARLVAEKRT
jgi:acyl carrier protein